MFNKTGLKHGLDLVWMGYKSCLTLNLIILCRFSTSAEPRGILGKENSKPIPVKKIPLHRSVSFTEPEHERKVDKQIGRCKSAATLETMWGLGSDSENLSGEWCGMRC